jgi:hypothetical protein
LKSIEWLQRRTALANLKPFSCNLNSTKLIVSS